MAMCCVKYEVHIGGVRYWIESDGDMSVLKRQTADRESEKLYSGDYEACFVYLQTEIDEDIDFDILNI